MTRIGFAGHAAGGDDNHGRRRRPSWTLGPETKVTIGSVVAIVVAVGSATLYLSTLLHTVQTSIDALKTEQKQAWTVSDMERYSHTMQWSNPTVKVPNPLEIIRSRPSLDRAGLGLGGEAWDYMLHAPPDGMSLDSTFGAGVR